MRRPAVVKGKVMRTPSYEDVSYSSPAAQQVENIVFGFNQDYVAHDARTHTRDKALLVSLGVDGDVPFDVAVANAGLLVAANDNFKHAIAA
jgi:hypothetical protein